MPTLFRLTLALLISIPFALVAWRLKTVSGTGALAGGVVALSFLLSPYPLTFVVLGTVFLLTWAATRAGHTRKSALGLAERPSGRNGSQVLANLGVAALAASFTQSWFLGQSAWENALLAAAIAALAEATADTLSSELGQVASARAYLLPTFHPVPAGTNGAVTLLGTLAGVGGAVAVSATAWELGLLPTTKAGVVAGAALVGMFADSLLGATLERRGWLSNDGVNLLGTLTAAAVAGLLLR